MSNSLSSGLRVPPRPKHSQFSYAVAPSPAPVSAASTTSRRGVKLCAPGPWGEIEYHYMYLEASNERVSEFKMPSTVPRWSFPGQTKAGLADFFQRTGIAPAVIERWLGACWLEQGGVAHVLVPVGDLEALTVEQRGAIYAVLAEWECNAFHRDPVFITGGDARAFLEGADIGQEDRAWFERMCYRRGSVLCFADIPALLGRARSDSDARRLFKLCSRTRTLVARMRLGPQTDYAALEDYWTKGGRRKDVLTMLRSVAGAPGAEHLDIIHLLPPLPRKWLFSYPPLELAIHGRMPDCHWSSLNFFNYEPLDYYLDTRLAASHVLERYEPVDAPYRFGDVLFFLEGPDARAFHSCVFIADDIVFSNNGENAAAPWVFSHLGDLREVYLSRAGGRIQAYRPK